MATTNNLQYRWTKSHLAKYIYKQCKHSRCNVAVLFRSATTHNINRVCKDLSVEELGGGG